MIGRDYYMHDYYYADISNITYTGHNFLLYVQKPFLFSPKHFYIYSSKDGVTWKRKFTSMFGGLGDAVPYHGFGLQQIFDESGVWYGFDPEDCLSGKCKSSKSYYLFYLLNFPVYNSGKCSIYYQTSPNSVEYVNVLNSKNCETNWHSGSTKVKPFLRPTQESYPKDNLRGFITLNNLVKRANLNINLGIPHTIYGDGKYIGVYKQVDGYYLFISSDGIHYEIKKLPSDITSSLAIKVFSE